MPEGFDSFIQVRAETRSAAKAKQPALPSTPDTYEKKESGGVIGLLYNFKGDLKADMAAVETEEKHGAKEYTRLMTEAQATRATDTKSLNQKRKAKASLDQKFVEDKDLKEQTVEEIHNL